MQKPFRGSSNIYVNGIFKDLLYVKMNHCGFIDVSLADGDVLCVGDNYSTVANGRARSTCVDGPGLYRVVLTSSGDAYSFARGYIEKIK
jgi:hypothetical protein